MSITFRCPHCSQRLSVKDEMAGKRAACPKCRDRVVIPNASPSRAGEQSKPHARKSRAQRSPEKKTGQRRRTQRSSGEDEAWLSGNVAGGQSLFQEVMSGFSGEIRSVRRTVFYRVGVVLVALAVVLLPILYVALIGLLGWGVYWHTTENLHVASMGTGRGRVMAVLAYAAPVVAGSIAVLFMLKPLLARTARPYAQVSLNRSKQKMLFAFVDKICDSVGAPRPTRIDVSFDVNAAAGFGSGFWSVFKSDLVLVVGLPLVAGMSLQQFAGVLAHEFGHFSQGTAMRVSWIVRHVNHWFAKVVYTRDEWDVWLTSVSEELDLRITWIFWIARLVVFLSRLVLWCFMMVSHMLTCWLARQMEFDADRYEARLAGSETFRKTCLRLQCLNYGLLAYLHGGPPPDSNGNPIRDIVAYSDSIPGQDLKQIKKHIKKSENGWFDTHPADSERIASAKREEAEGIFHSDLPAETVVKHFDRLCNNLLQRSS